MKIILFATLITLSLAIVPYNPDDVKTVEEMATGHGYPFETHQVTTEDGAILGTWRIPHGRNSDVTAKGSVFIMHGLFDWGFTWFLYDDPDKSLPYMLADNGYDVWIGNQRGTFPSMTHTKYSSSDKEFWQYSLDEFALYDVPGNIEYIKKAAAVDKVHYIGHSQGTAQMFAALMHNPDLQDSVHSYMALGPVIKVEGMTSAAIPFLDKYHVMDVLGWFGIYSIGLPDAFRKYAPYVCRFAPSICTKFIGNIPGPDLLAPEMTQVVVAHEIAATSTKNGKHWLQIINTGKTQMFDWGSEDANQQHYGQTTPPLYPDENLGKLTIPILLSRGSVDSAVDMKDFTTLRSLLPETVEYLPIEGWAHLGYNWAPNAYQLLYPKLMDFMEKSVSQ